MSRLLRSPYGLCLLLVSAMTGLISVGYPVALEAAGFSKDKIAVFFVVDSLTAFAVALTASRPAPLRHARPLLVAALVAGAGGVALVGGRSLPLVCLGGALSMAAAVTLPLILRQIQTSPGTAPLSDSVLAAGTRWIAVAGYLAGVAGFGASASLTTRWPEWTPVHAAVPLLLAAAALAAAGTRSAAVASRTTSAGSAHEPPPPATPGLLLVAGVAALVLLKAADSVRLVYLPLFVVASGRDERLISVLFLATAAVELLVLPLLGRLGDRRPAPLLLGAAGVVGVLSFAVSAGFASLDTLLLSQLLYAPFTAALQALGPLLLGRLLVGGLPAGAGFFAALMQLGSLIGILAPLTVPGYSPGLFWIAAAFCAVAATVLLRVRSTPALSLTSPGGTR
ncbi:hypothetical protein ACFV4E_15645 [Streptomyces hygroscopicus]|uniref:MFS transporter n=1 Tax=Streptomyces demainii TaxID=588122 RepID=A0ABT9L7Y4_9ACTN|nr:MULTISPECIES: hypothetical protein [Streptomyces]MDN3060075.1 hypothetical protein [Streptomyces sp. SRF1]MDP9616400.1 hypothetical protein [Streptomyces demainii]